METLWAAIGWIFCALAVAGSLYMMAAAFTLHRFFAAAPAWPRREEGVTILKPLHGAEPRLAENLASFLKQDHGGPIQLLCGVQRADDPAIAVVERLRARFPRARIDLVIDSTPHGANRKIANLINMAPAVEHEVVVLSDSDMVAPRNYLSGLLAALNEAGVGVATLAYAGRGDAGRWSRIAAAGLGWQFLPGAVFGVAHGLARPCMGSTIAMRREVLGLIGGFRAFADVLADDYAIGEAVSGLGLAVVVPPLLVIHACDERDLPSLWRHELRWGVTLKAVAPVAYAASIVGYPLPLALIGCGFHPGTGGGIALLAVLARGAVALVANRVSGAAPAPLWVLPFRDCLGFVVFLASFAARSVDWRGSRLRMGPSGRVTAEPENSHS